MINLKNQKVSVAELLSIFVLLNVSIIYLFVSSYWINKLIASIKKKGNVNKEISSGLVLFYLE